MGLVCCITCPKSPEERHCPSPDPTAPARAQHGTLLQVGGRDLEQPHPLADQAHRASQEERGEPFPGDQEHPVPMCPQRGIRRGQRDQGPSLHHGTGAIHNGSGGSCQLHQRLVRPHHEAQEAEEADGDVLGDDEGVHAFCVVGGDLQQWGEDESQGAAADGAHQRDDDVQARDEDGQHAWRRSEDDVSAAGSWTAETLLP